MWNEGSGSVRCRHSHVTHSTGMAVILLLHITHTCELSCTSGHGPVLVAHCNRYNMFLAELPDAWDIPDKVHATVQGVCACLLGRGVVVEGNAAGQHS